MRRRPPRSTQGRSSAASDVYKRQVLGIVGALVGGFIGTALGLGSVTGFNLASFLLAVAGAIVVLILFKIIRKSKP